MGIIRNFVNSKTGKVIKWASFGAVAISSAGVGQQAMHYQESRDPNGDMFELVQTDADNPTYSRNQLKEKAGVETTPGEKFSWGEQASGETAPTKQSMAGSNAAIADSPASERLSRATWDRVGHTGIETAQEQVEVTVPGDTLRTMIDTYRETPGGAEKIDGLLNKANTTVENKVEVSAKVEGTSLATVRVPLPTGEKALFHVNAPNLGSKDFYKSPLNPDNWTTLNPTGTSLGSVQEEEMPVAISYSVDQPSPDVRVESRLIDSDVKPRPPSDDKPYILLAGVQTDVFSENDSMEIPGSVKLEQDLDGSHTQEKIRRLQGKMADKGASPEQVRRAAEQVLQLNQRKVKSSRLNGRLKETGFDDTLNKLFDDQQYDLTMPMSLPTDQPLVKATHYFWLGPDRDDDGKADIYVTQQLDLSGIEKVDTGELRVKPKQIDSEDGKLLNLGSELIQDKVASQMKSTSRNIEEGVKVKAQAALKKVVSAQLPNVEKIADGAVNNLIRDKAKLDTSIDHSLFQKEFNFSVDSIRVVKSDQGPQAVIRVNTGDMAPGQAGVEMAQSLVGTSQVESGNILLSGDGAAINRMLKDQSQGGSVNWKEAFSQLKKSGKVSDIYFNKDANGNTVYPRLLMKDGKPAINVDMTVYLNGVGVVETGTDVIKGAADVIDGGSKFITDNTVGKLGKPGKVVGDVIHSPFWLIGKVVGGAKDVVDSTVGRVVDVVPKAATGSKLTVNASIPLDFDTGNGDLTVSADSKGLELSDSRFDSETSPLDVIPTRVMVSAIAQAVAESNPGIAVDQDKPIATQQVDASDQGVNFENIRFTPGARDKYGDTVPNIQVEISPGSRLPDVMARLAGGNVRS